MGNSGEKIENVDNKDQYGNDIIEIIAYDTPIGSHFYGKNYCPVPKSVLEYIGEPGYQSISFDKEYIEKLLIEIPEGKGLDKHEELEKRLKYLDKIFINGSMDEIEQEIKNYFNVDEYTLSDRELSKEIIFKMIDQFDIDKLESGKLCKGMVEIYENKPKMNDELFSEMEEWFTQPSVVNGFDSDTPSLIRKLHRDSNHFVELVNTFGYHSNFTLDRVRLMFCMVMINVSAQIKENSNNRNKNDDLINLQLLKENDNDLNKINIYLYERSKQVRTNKKFVELLKDISAVKANLKKNYKYYSDDEMSCCYSNMTRKEVDIESEIRNGKRESNNNNDKMITREIEIYLFAKGIDVDYNNATRVIEFFNKINISITRETYEKLKTHMTMSSSHLILDTCGDSVQNFFEKTLGILKEIGVDISDKSRHSIILSFIRKEFIDEKYNNINSHTETCIYDGYEQTLKYFYICEIPKIMFDFDLFDCKIGSGMHMHDRSGEVIFVDEVKYMAMRTILKLKILAEKTNAIETEQIMDSIKGNKNKHFPW